MGIEGDVQDKSHFHNVFLEFDCDEDKFLGLLVRMNLIVNRKSRSYILRRALPVGRQDVEEDEE
jgi:hypothetical protein